jgi:hypothetical protein
MASSSNGTSSNGRSMESRTGRSKQSKFDLDLDASAIATLSGKPRKDKRPCANRSKDSTRRVSVSWPA